MLPLIEETLTNSFSERTVNIIQKPNKDSNKKENYKLISLMNIDANIINKMHQTESENTSKTTP